MPNPRSVPKTQIGEETGDGPDRLDGGIGRVSEGYRKHVGNFAAQFQESFFQLPIDLLAPTSPSNQQQTIIVAWIFVFSQDCRFWVGLPARVLKGSADLTGLTGVLDGIDGGT